MAILATTGLNFIFMQWHEDMPHIQSKGMLRLSFYLFCVIILAKNGESGSFFTYFSIPFAHLGNPTLPNSIFLSAQVRSVKVLSCSSYLMVLDLVWKNMW